jgi:hypothetical protein
VVKMYLPSTKFNSLDSFPKEVSVKELHECSVQDSYTGSNLIFCQRINSGTLHTEILGSLKITESSTYSAHNYMGNVSYIKISPFV